MVLALMPALTPTASAAEYSGTVPITSDTSISLADVTGATTFNVSGSGTELTVTGTLGDPTAADFGITFSIGAGATVNWTTAQFTTTGSLRTGGQSAYAVVIGTGSLGTFNMPGGSIANTRADKNATGMYVLGGIVNVSGGSVSATGGNGRGIYNETGGTVNVTGGTVAGTGTGAGIGTGIVIGAGGTVNVSGGTITGNNNGISNNNTGTVTITGGTVEVNGGTSAFTAAPTLAGVFYYRTGADEGALASCTETLVVFPDAAVSALSGPKYVKIEGARNSLVFDGTVLEYYVDGTANDVEVPASKYTYDVDGAAGEKPLLTLDSISFTTSAATALDLTALPEGATVNFEGENNFVSTYNDTGATYGIIFYNGDSLSYTIAGTGSVTAIGGTSTNSSSYGIHVYNNYSDRLNISDGVTVEARGGAASQSRGIYALSDIAISGSANVTATGGTASGTGDSFGIYSNNGNVTISDSATLETTGGAAGAQGSFGVVAGGSSITISGSANVTAQSIDTDGDYAQAFNKPLTLAGVFNYSAGTSNSALSTKTPIAFSTLSSYTQKYVYIGVDGTLTFDGANETNKLEYVVTGAEPVEVPASTNAASGLNYTYADTTLTLNAISFTTSAATALDLSALPDGATVQFEGDNSFVSTYSDTGTTNGILLGDDAADSYTLTGPGSVTATGGEAEYSRGFAVENGTLTITGSANVTATGGTASESFGIAAATIAISGGTVTASGGTSAFNAAPTLAGVFNYRTGADEVALASCTETLVVFPGEPVSLLYGPKYAYIGVDGNLKFESDSKLYYYIDSDNKQELPDDKYTYVENGEEDTLTLTDISFTTTAATALDLSVLDGGATVQFAGTNSFVSTYNDTGNVKGIAIGSGSAAYTFTGAAGSSVTATGGTSTSGGSYGVYVYGDLTVNGALSVTATGGTAASSSRGFAAEYGTLTISESASVTATGDSYGVVAYTIEINGGTITASGNTRAFDREPTLPTNHTWTASENSDGSNSTSDNTSGTGYTYDENHKYVKIEPYTPPAPPAPPIYNPPSPPAPPVQNIPAQGGEVQVPYTEQDGGVSLQLPAEKTDEILAAATETGSDKADFDLSGNPAVTTATAPTTALETLVEAGLGLEFNFAGGSAQLDNDAAADILAKAEGDTLEIKVEEIPEISQKELNSEQIGTLAVGDTVYDVSVISNGVEIHEFAGTITITVPYTGKQPVKAWFMGDKGKSERIDGVYDPLTKTFTFTVPHLSYWVVGHDAAWPFTDVVEDDSVNWFYSDVKFVWENGLMQGTSDTLFSPNSATTRAMLWTILARLSGETITGETWAQDARAWALAEGVSDGTNPDKFVTRNQIVTMLYRYAGVGSDGYGGEAMAWAEELKIMNDGRPDDSATRAEIAAILHRFVDNVAAK
jgi:hypothetical protein